MWICFSFWGLNNVMVMSFDNSTWVLFNANYVWQVHIWSWFLMVFFLQTWNLNVHTKWCGVLAIYFHGVKERNPNHEQKQNQSTKETARDTHSSHSSIPPDNTLRIINCTNRIISISKRLFCLFGKICLFQNIPLWIFQKNLFEKAGTEQFWKNYDLWQKLTCLSVKKYPQASCEGSIRIKYMGKFFQDVKGA